MELNIWKDRILEGAKKYRYGLLVLLLGVALMLIPSKEMQTQEQTVQPEHTSENIQSIDDQLAQILSQIKGAGKVEVMLTLKAGEETLYQTDQSIRSGDNGASQWDTVIVTGADRAQSGLVTQVNPATYLGAIIVCEGADKASVRLAVVDAVSKVTGLGADQISVLKMK